MSARPHAINLQFGKSAFRYQDVILLPFVSVLRENMFLRDKPQAD
jgi:hypothetical protein